MKEIFISADYDLYDDRFIFRQFYGDYVFEYIYYFDEIGYVYMEAICLKFLVICILHQMLN